MPNIASFPDVSGKIVWRNTKDFAENPEKFAASLGFESSQKLQEAIQNDRNDTAKSVHEVTAVA